MAFEYDQGHTDSTQWLAEVYERLFYALSVKVGEVRGTRNTRLKTIESKHRKTPTLSQGECISERLVITYTEIPLVPDDDDFLFFLHFSEQ
jgi:hypothetical protein